MRPTRFPRTWASRFAQPLAEKFDYRDMRSHHERRSRPTGLQHSGWAKCVYARRPPIQPVNVLVLPTPLPTGNLSVIVFEDDDPLNGEQDGGGGNGTVAPIEPGLGGFNLVLWDTYGGLGDVTGQDTYDAFNMPLSNSLAGTIDPSSGLDACPVSANSTSGPAAGAPPQRVASRARS